MHNQKVFVFLSYQITNEKIEIMEFKGTKGNWILKYWDRDDSYDVYNESEDEFVCTTMNSLDLEKYNALLISKAPEMLEMLKKLLSKMPLNTDTEAESYHEVLTLIKQATEV